MVGEHAVTARLAHVAAGLRRVTVQLAARGGGAGSGIVWRADGLIVTSAHVARSTSVDVTLDDGRVFASEVAAWDPERDLAALTIDAGGLTAAVVGDSDAVRVGELVLAVGNPLGLSGAVSAGMIHTVLPRRPGRWSWLQADLRLAPGNSGGPLADAQGRVIGINAMIAGGLALALPSHEILRFLAEAASNVGGRRPRARVVTAGDRGPLRR